MAKRDANGAMRRRLLRLRKSFKKLDYRALDRESRFKNMENTIDILLHHLPKVTGGHPDSAEHTKSDGCKLVQKIKDKLEKYRKIPVGACHKMATRSCKAEESIAPHARYDDQSLSKKKRSRSLDSGSRANDASCGKKARTSHGEDDDDCVISKVVKCSKQEQEQGAIETEMARMDESLWYDPSIDFDEDMLP